MVRVVETLSCPAMRFALEKGNMENGATKLPCAPQATDQGDKSDSAVSISWKRR